MSRRQVSMDEGPGMVTQPSVNSQVGLGATQNVSINDIDMYDEEDAPQVQDENIGRVFEYFLRTFVADDSLHVDFNNGEFSDDEEAIDACADAAGDAFGDHEDDLDAAAAAVRNLYHLDGDLSKPLYYMKRIYNLCSKESQDAQILNVHTDHIINWQPIGTDVPPINLNVQLYRYIAKNFLRVQDTLEDKLQALADATSLSLGRLSKKFFLQFSHTVRLVYPIREIKCQMLGELITLRGQVTRISDVRPELVLATFRCKSCNNIIMGVRQQFKYTVPRKCTGAACLNTSEWELLLESCHFCDWQKVRIQEMVSESEAGSMPRSIDVILRHKLVDCLNAGDRVQVSGSLVVLPDLPSLMKPGDIPKSVNKQSVRRFESSLVSQGLTGIKGVGVRDLNHKLAFLACQVRRINQYSLDLPISSMAAANRRNDAIDEHVRAEDVLSLPGLDWLSSIASSNNTIEILASCIAPRVWGHLEIKKGILLMMVGGVHKSSSNAKLRGDVNMCIVGDPSVAKSQLLKFVADFAPRAVFASGKGSTAAGLTAAVHRDPDNGEYILEAGALMYADEGICCIDEFDKMNERDRVAIHEAMEQQTISITKAGIQATLNARASVLAACNPKYGRYDSSKSFAANVNLPPPLLSRFDLLYTMQDEAIEEVDTKIAQHITSHYGKGTFKSTIEKYLAAAAADGVDGGIDLDTDDNVVGDQDDDDYDDDATTADTSGTFKTPLTLDELKLYIELAKRIKPLIQDGAKHKLAHFYVGLRNGDVEASRKSLRMTVRQLESLVRLSEAVARLKFSNFVNEEHVEQAYHIFRASLLRLCNKQQVVFDDEDLQVAIDIANSLGAASLDTSEQVDVDDEIGGAATFSNVTAAGTDEQASAPSVTRRVAPVIFRLTALEYESIAAVLLDHVNEQEIISNGIASNELIEWYIADVLVPSSPQEADAWNLKLQRIVHRLVHVDNKLLASPLEGGIFHLRVHPNYYSSSHLWKREKTYQETETTDANVEV